MDKGKKYIHYCWFGDKKLSRLAKKCIKSWKKYLPEYEVICWNEKNVDINACPFVREAYEQKKWAFVADYARAKAMDEYGGIYLDTDMLIKRDLKELMQHESFLGVEDSGAIAVGIWWASKPGNFLAKELVKFYEEQEHFNSNDIYKITMPAIITRILEKHGFDKKEDLPQEVNGIYVCPRDYFYPLSYDYHNNAFSKNTYAIHYYDASWASKNEKRTIRLIRKIGPKRAGIVMKVSSKSKGVLRYYYSVVKNTVKLIFYPIRLIFKRKKFADYKQKIFDNFIDALNRTGDEKYIVFYNKEWLGTSSAARNLFGSQAIPLEPFDGDMDFAKKVADELIARKIKMVVFSGLTFDWCLIAQELKKKLEDKIIIKEFWQGGMALNIEKCDWKLFEKMVNMLDAGVFDSVAFAKKSMYEQFKALGYKTEFLSNIFTISEKQAEFSKKGNKKSDNIKIGIYASGDRWVKNFYNQLAAVSLVNNATVDVVPMSTKVKDFAKILRVNISGEAHNLSHDELLARIAQNDIVLYVTFTECSPILPLECLDLGVICLTSNNHHYWENSELQDYLVVNKNDNPLEIAKQIEKCLKHKEKILKLYREWKVKYDKECKKLLNDFLKLD